MNIFLKFHDQIISFSSMMLKQRDSIYLLKRTGSLVLIIRSIITIAISKDLILILIDQNHFDSIKDIKDNTIEE